ncbi:MAG: protein-export chaperone SecB [Pseudomonadota bacterium]
MADESPTPATPTQATTGKPGTAVRVLAQYIKDFSFENPGTARAQTQPNIDLGIDVGATPHQEGQNIFEVSLRLQAKATADQRTLFVLELDFAGLFQFDTNDQVLLEPILLVECPRLLFPFARRIIADITRDGGFPPLLVDPIDFVGLYRGQKARQTAPAEAPTGQAPPTSV